MAVTITPPTHNNNTQNNNNIVIAANAAPQKPQTAPNKKARLKITHVDGTETYLDLPPDQHTLLQAETGAKYQIVDADTGQVLTEYQGHRQGRDLYFYKDGTQQAIIEQAYKDGIPQIEWLDAAGHNVIATATTVSTASAAGPLVGLLALMGGGMALAGGGGGGGGSTPDTTKPVITSGTTAAEIKENSGAGQLIYTATATDNIAVTSYSLGGTDASAFSIDATTGKVTLTANPDADAQAAYSFIVTAKDAAGNISTEQTVTLNITNLDETAPTFKTAITTAKEIKENSGEGQVVFTASATDNTSATDSATPTGVKTYALDGADKNLFSIDATTGAVTLTGNPDADAQASYSFTVTATDNAGNISTEQTVTLNITNLDETAPTFKTAITTAKEIKENSGEGQVVFTASATDNTSATDSAIPTGVKTYALDGKDKDLFSIDATTGAVTLTGNPDADAQAAYSFTVTATDVAGNISEAQTVTLNITNLDETAPTFKTAITTAKEIKENSGEGQVVFTASATDAANAPTDTATPTGVKTYALDGKDKDLFSIDATTGAVTLTGNPDADAQAAYSFTVTATDNAGNISEAQTVTLNITNLDETAPTFKTATAIATEIKENSGEGQVVFTASATDNTSATDSATPTGVKTYAIDGTDKDLFSIDATTGAVTLTGSPDADAKASYSFIVTAKDAAGNISTEQTVTLNITNLDETAPTFKTAIATAKEIIENSGEGQVVFTASATDAANAPTDTATPTGVKTYALDGKDKDLFSIDATTGAVTLTGNPDADAQAAYSFTVTATDVAGNISTEQTVTLNITNLDETAPTFKTATAIATEIKENSGEGQVVFTASATDNTSATDSATPTGVKTYALDGKDKNLFSINATSGAVTLTGSPDADAQASYEFTVTATDNAGNISEAQTVTLNITNLDETKPVISNETLTASVDEGIDIAVYTVTTTDVKATPDTADSSGGIKYSFATGGVDNALFAIDETSGAVTFIKSPDADAPLDAGVEGIIGVKDNVYDIKVQATDKAGNVSDAKNIAITVNNLDETKPVIKTMVLGGAPKGDAVIDLGEFGKLINPIQIDTDGNGTKDSWFYYWDKDGNGTNVTPQGGAGDALTHDVLDGIFNNDINGVVNTTVANNDGNFGTTDTYRYATINGVKLALPTIGNGGVAGELTANSNYTDLAEVWDSNNATLPTNWLVSPSTRPFIWSATAAVTNPNSGHLVIATFPNPNNVIVTFSGSAPDTFTGSVALQVLPTLTETTAVTVKENITTSTVLFSVTNTDLPNTATDTAPSSGDIKYSFAGGADDGLFDINATTGAVTFIAKPNFETPTDADQDNIYKVKVKATDKAGNKSDPTEVTITVADLDETKPVISSATTASVDEGVATTVAVYTATSTDDAKDGDQTASSGIASYTLGNVGNGTDADKFNIDADGKVTFRGKPDFETQSSYSFTVTATDKAGNVSTAQTVTLTVNNVDETKPVITNETLTASVDENIDTTTAVYTVTTTDVKATPDTADSSGGIKYSFATGGVDNALFAINETSGAVTFIKSPDADAPLDAGVEGIIGVKDNVYDIKVQATDKAGNVSDAKNIAITVNNLDETKPVIKTMALPTGQEIDLGTNGKLIKPVHIDTDGNGTKDSWFYYWDRSGDGTSADTGTLNGGQDYTTHDVLDGIFTKDINGNGGNSTTNADGNIGTNNIYRYADMLDANGATVKLALPTIGNGSTNVTAYASLTDNQTYTDLAEIWDVHNTAAGTAGAPTGWPTDSVWSATPSFDGHALLNFYDGSVNSEIDDGSVYVAVQVLPTLTETNAVTVKENIAASTVLFSVTNTDLPNTQTDTASSSGRIKYSFAGGADDTLFAIDPTTGAVTFIASPDFETKKDVGTDNIYNVKVKATDLAGNVSDAKDVAITVTNVVDDVAPAITNTVFTGSIDENATTAAYTVTATDLVDFTNQTITYAFATGGVDNDLFDISATTGAVTFKVSPDFETKKDVGTDNTYDIKVQVSDATGNTSIAQDIAITVKNVVIEDAVGPAITNTAFSASVAENRSTTAAVYTVTATDTVAFTDKVITYALAGGADDALFAIDKDTGAVTFKASPDFETKKDVNADNVYDIKVKATDATGNISEIKDVAITVTDLAQPKLLVTSAAPVATLLEATGNTAGFDQDPQVTAIGTAGAYVVTWTGADSAANGGEDSIYLQQFTAAGTKVGESPVLLEATGFTGGNDLTPQVTAIGTAGAYVVTWGGTDSAANGNTDNSIYVQQFDANGTKVGATPVLLEATNFTGGNDITPQVTAIGTAGAYVVTWTGPDSAANGNTDNSIYVQQFTAAGTKVGESPVLLEATGNTGGADTTPQVTAIGTAGAYVVTWRGLDSAANGSDNSIYVQQFTAEGAKATTNPVLLEATGNTTGSDETPQVTAIGTEGAYVVTWTGKDSAANGGDNSIYLQQFTAAGTKVGESPVLLEATGNTVGSDRIPQVTAIGTAGAYVVTWSGLDHPGNDDFSIYVQQFTADGNKAMTNPVQLEATGNTGENDSIPQVTAIGTEGAYVVTWTGKDSAANGGDNSIYVQQFTAAGTKVGESPVLLEATGNTGGADTTSQVTAIGTAGAYVVTWRGLDSDANGGDYSIYVQAFNADGSLKANTVDGTADVTKTATDTVQFKFATAGDLYLVADSLISAGTEQTNFDTLLANLATNDAAENHVGSITANTATNVALTGLSAGTYHAYVLDSVTKQLVSDISNYGVVI